MSKIKITAFAHCGIPKIYDSRTGNEIVNFQGFVIVHGYEHPVLFQTKLIDSKRTWKCITHNAGSLFTNLNFTQPKCFFKDQYEFEFVFGLGI